MPVQAAVFYGPKITEVLNVLSHKKQP